VYSLRGNPAFILPEQTTQSDTEQGKTTDKIVITLAFSCLAMNPDGQMSLFPFFASHAAELLGKHPDCQVVIIGGNGVSYDGENGDLVDFFDGDVLIGKCCTPLPHWRNLLLCALQPGKACRTVRLPGKARGMWSGLKSTPFKRKCRLPAVP
jgi:hypothetical protein